jgi:hypothetical protein
LPPDHPQRVDAIGRALDRLAEQLGAIASELRDLLAHETLFGEDFGYVRWQLLTMLTSLGLHEGTARQLRRVIARQAIDSQAVNGDERR